MGAFEHIISLLSFVFALAITHLLLTVVGLIRNWSRVRWSAPHALWLLNGLITVVANWLSFWDMRTLGTFGIGTILFTLALSFATYIQVALVCPDLAADGPIDLPRFHDEQSRRYVGAFVVTCVAALAGNFVFGEGFRIAEWARQNLAVVPMIVVAVPAMFVRARGIQLGAPLVLMAVWFYYFAALQGALH